MLIESDADIEEGLLALRSIDPSLEAVIGRAGHVPLRRSRGGYSGLAEIIVSQQVSKAAADAIWGRVVARFPDFPAEDVMAAKDEDLQGCGLSRPKIRTMRAAAEAVTAGDLCFATLAELPADEAMSMMTAVKGIGPWTAEIYLLFCLGHRDIFPAGDIALQAAVADAYGMEERPKPKDLYGFAERWSPWRGVAARLFWAYYREMRGGRDSMPL